MKITSQEEYGLRCILRIAVHGAGPISVRTIAEEEGLSAAYVEKLLRLLARGGLTYSVRGIRGGYSLSRAADKISVGEVMHSLGGSLTTQEICSKFTGDRPDCIHISNCGLRPVWVMAHHIEEFLNQTPLSSLLRDEREVEKSLQLERSKHVHA